MAKAKSRSSAGPKKSVESKKQVRRKTGGKVSLARKSLEVIFDAYLAKHLANRAIVRPAANLAKAGDLRTQKNKQHSKSKHN